MTFESGRCLPCESELGFDWDARQIVALHGRARCAGTMMGNRGCLVNADAELVRRLEGGALDHLLALGQGPSAAPADAARQVHRVVLPR